MALFSHNGQHFTNTFISSHIICRENFFQEGDSIHYKMDVGVAYTKALNTWANWVDKNVNKNQTQVFFAGYSNTHFQ